MGIRITHVRFGGTNRTEGEIIRYRWVSDQTGKAGESDMSALVEWIDFRGGEAYVDNGIARVRVRVVKSRAGRPHLRTYADGLWTNDLVDLDTY
ncbi:DUF3892 domain-containing protein [Microbacterium sp. HMH0099]